MAYTVRRTREKQQRAESILDAAEKVFFAKGFNNSSMDEIATEAQLSRALLYVYYKDKSAIMLAIMRRAAAALEARFAEARKQGDTGLAQIEGIGFAYYGFSREQSDYFDALTDLNTFALPKEPSEDLIALEQSRAHITQLMVDALSQGVRDGSLNADRVSDPLRTAYFLQGALHGVIMATRNPHAKAQKYADSDGLIRYAIAMAKAAMAPDR